MKRIWIVLLCGLLLTLCPGCGGNGQASDRIGGLSAVDSAEDSSIPEVSAFQAPQDTTSSAMANLTPAANATVIESQNYYDSAYCFQPETDGTYHFCAQTADAFQGRQLGYDKDTITWTIYVLDEALQGSWRQLEQEARPSVNDLNSSTDLALRAGQYVYCVCSLNATTSQPAPDGAGALSITPIETDYTPSASNNYQLDITINSESRFDLDGDGNTDTIYYSVLSNPSANSGIYTETLSTSLTINDTELLHPEQNNSTADYGLWLENPDVEYYYIVDLDVNDSYRELAIGDCGSNGETSTHYFRYQQGELVYLGRISGLPDDHTTIFHGDGTVSAMTPLKVLQNWSGLRTYRLSDGQLQMMESEYCPPQLPDGWNVTLLKPLKVYSMPDQTSEQLVLNPSSFSLSFPLTDGEHWVEIRCADGTSGWAYFPEYGTVVSGDQTLNTSDVFGNLHLPD